MTAVKPAKKKAATKTRAKAPAKTAARPAAKKAARKTAIAREQLATWRANNRNQVRDARRARLITRLCANHLVDAAQVRKAGACQAGIDAWCRAHSVAPDSALPLPVLALLRIRVQRHQAWLLVRLVLPVLL